MWEFINEHLEGIIALFIGGTIPIVAWLFKVYKNNILSEVEDNLNIVSKRLDYEINLIKEKLIILKENLSYLSDKQEYLNTNLKNQLDKIEDELRQLDKLKDEILQTKQIMIFQHKEQIEEFKNFCQNILKR